MWGRFQSRPMMEGTTWKATKNEHDLSKKNSKNIGLVCHIDIWKTREITIQNMNDCDFSQCRKLRKESWWRCSCRQKGSKWSLQMRRYRAIVSPATTSQGRHTGRGWGALASPPPSPSLPPPSHSLTTLSITLFFPEDYQISLQMYSFQTAKLYRKHDKISNIMYHFKMCLPYLSCWLHVCLSPKSLLHPAATVGTPLFERARIARPQQPLAFTGPWLQLHFGTLFQTRHWKSLPCQVPENYSTSQIFIRVHQHG